MGRLARAWQWVTGSLSLVASVLAIVSHVGGPLKLVGGLEVHPTAWILVVTVFAGLFGASVVHPVIDRWMLAPWRARVERFRGLKQEIVAVRNGFDQDLADRAHRQERGAPRAALGPQRLRHLHEMADMDARLRNLGIGFFGSSGGDMDFATLIDMMERGALREAQKRFPLSERRQPTSEQHG